FCSVSFSSFGAAVGAGAAGAGVWAQTGPTLPTANAATATSHPPLLKLMPSSCWVLTSDSGVSTPRQPALLPACAHEAGTRPASPTSRALFLYNAPPQITKLFAWHVVGAGECDSDAIAPR